MEASCFGGYANATDLADYLVRKGMPFRTAHGVAANAVRLGIEKNCNLEDLSIEEYKNISPIIDDDVFEVLPPKFCVEARKTIGGPAPDGIKSQIKMLKEFTKTVNEGN